MAIRIEVFNRGPEDAELNVLPHLWFRNMWTWTDPPGPEPVIALDPDGALRADDSTSAALPNLPFDYRLGRRYLSGPPRGVPLFTFNETKGGRIFCPGAGCRRPDHKDRVPRV